MPVTRRRNKQLADSSPQKVSEPDAGDITDIEASPAIELEEALSTASGATIQALEPAAMKTISRHSIESRQALSLARAREELIQLEAQLAAARIAVLETEEEEFNTPPYRCISPDIASKHGTSREKVIPNIAAEKTPAGFYTATTPSHKNDIAELASVIASAVRAGQERRYIGDLPTFNGAHYDWLAFKAAYMESSSHFTEIENIARLRQSLMGKAKEAVYSLLIANAKAQDIMATLEMRFGRPDSIALAEIENLRNLPYPSARPVQWT